MTVTDKKILLARHRRRRRIVMTCSLIGIFAVGTLVAWWLASVILLVAWIGHEAWFSDHLFYSPQDDHRYDFQGDVSQVLDLDGDVLRSKAPLQNADTWILRINVRARLSGCFLDPYVLINGERFDFERGARGLRYLALAGTRQGNAAGSWRLECHHCTVSGSFEVTGFQNPAFEHQRVLVVAPHADDAELAAFGLYQQTSDVMIVTLTQGEIEAEFYEKLGLDRASAARLKGRLRSWDSMAIPLWGNVPAAQCFQLGYYCMRLSEMREHPQESFGSRQSSSVDIREARVWNQRSLPADADGLPTWNNLVGDLSALVDQFAPDVIVTPHPEIDPHPDHVAASAAVREALMKTATRPTSFLLYANHLHNNDRWPMGPVGGGITLPPAFTPQRRERYWVCPLTPTVQIDKALALAMQHDLQTPAPAKKRLRRHIQRLLAGRTWPPTGENEYFRKAVRSCELFTVRQDLD